MVENNISVKVISYIPIIDLLTMLYPIIIFKMKGYLLDDLNEDFPCPIFGRCQR